MVGSEVAGLFAGAVALGAVHGVEPGHGWPVAASYALERTNKWLYGLAASLILGVGHLVSSIAMVAVFFSAKAYFDLTRVNEPMTVLGGVQIGGPVSVVAGVVLVALGVREYRHGHGHPHGGHGGDDVDEHGRDDEHGHGHDDHDDREHSHDHDDREHGHGHDDREHGDGSLLGRVAGVLPFVGGHDHDRGEEPTDRGLWGIAWFAFVLGFAHEEEFEIIALCAGSSYCLELMAAYAVTVVLGIVGLTLALIAGYERSEERVEALTPYLPAFSAAVLVAMGVGFVLGVF